MLCRFALCALLALVAPMARAQDRAAPLILDLDGVLSLSERPWLGRRDFVAALGEVLPGLWLTPYARGEATADPFRWSVTATFGSDDGSRATGTRVACARYGLSTRDRFRDEGFTSPAGFALMQELLPQFDDAEAWPDGAVARLYCSVTWDDARVVAILPEGPARSGLEARFAVVERLAGGGAVQPGLYGQTGFRLRARGGAADTRFEVESARVVLTLGHQQVTFRSFLMGGGV
ncbi:hypothetical protein HKCCE2091_06320 [Rhodobacterales bacterium HKCCE2091]|nr:hypothetical protein [Rhodobacterales bacterium HKCCE2091]